MIKNPTKEQLRQLMDKAKLSHAVDDDGDFYVILHADQDYGYNVAIWFILNDKGILSVRAYSFDFKVNDQNKANIMFLCNKWNTEKRLPKAVLNLDRNQVQAEFDAILDEPVSEEYIIENCIKLPVSSSWNFFKSLVE